MSRTVPSQYIVHAAGKCGITRGSAGLTGGLDDTTHEVGV